MSIVAKLSLACALLMTAVAVACGPAADNPQPDQSKTPFGEDAGSGTDAAPVLEDAGVDAVADSAPSLGKDAGDDASDATSPVQHVDAGEDAGFDAGPPPAYFCELTGGSLRPLCDGDVQLVCPLDGGAEYRGACNIDGGPWPCPGAITVLDSTCDVVGGSSGIVVSQ